MAQVNPAIVQHRTEPNSDGVQLVSAVMWMLYDTAIHFDIEVDCIWRWVSFIMLLVGHLLTRREMQTPDDLGKMGVRLCTLYSDFKRRVR